jgi:single-strand DNA-binding protein
MNAVQLLGRFTRDNEFKELGSTSVFRNNIAVQRNFKNKDGERESDFINVVAFGKTAELLNQYFDKGQQVAVQGRIQTGSYEKEDGTRVYTTDVVVDQFDFVGSKNDNAQPATATVSKATSSPFGEVDFPDDALPF